MALNPIPQNPIGESFVWREWFQKLSDKVFGTLGQQDSNNVAITGGNLSNVKITGGSISNVQVSESFIDSSPVGLLIPSSGSFTVLKTNSLAINGGTNGQVLIGRTSDQNFVPHTLTAGTGIDIANGAGTVTISQSATTSKYYGAFHDTTTQTAAVINTAYAISFDSTDLSSGVARGSPTSRITITNAGIYNFQFSLQLGKTSGSKAAVYIWADIGGTAVPNSGTKVTLAGSSAFVVAAWNFMLSMSASTYFRLMWSTDDVDCQIITVAASSPVPDIPSVILTVQQV